MKVTTTYLTGFLCLFLTNFIFASNILVIESQSYHILHRQDEVWEMVAESMCHEADIVDQSFLDDFSNLEPYDALVVASGLIEISNQAVINIRQFVESGKNVYLQSEYAVDLPVNAAFEQIVNQLGGSFTWTAEHNGALTPMQIVGQLGQNVVEVDEVNYFWYGTSGQGDSTIEPFMNYGGFDFGFIFTPPNPAHGTVITSSDQDWVRLEYSIGLMSNVMAVLAQIDYDFTIEGYSDTPCDGNDYVITSLIEPYIPASFNPVYEWMINGEIVVGETTSTFEADLNEGDVVEATISFEQSCGTNGVAETILVNSNPFVVEVLYPISEPEITISTESTTLCQNEIGLFNANFDNSFSVDNYQFQWMNNGVVIGGESLNILYLPGIQDGDVITCTLIYEDICLQNILVNSNELNMTVLPVIDPQITIASNVQDICEGEAVSFFATGENLGLNPSFQWQIDNENIGEDADEFTTTSLTAGQTVTCFVTAYSECNGEIIVNSGPIVINQISAPVTPSIIITSDVNSICEGETATFTVVGENLGSAPVYQWLVDGSPVGNNTSYSSNTLTGNEVVSCIAISDLTCITTTEASAEAAAIEVILSSTIPSIEIIADQDEICAGQEITFTAQTTNAGVAPTYVWKVDNIVRIDETAPTFTVSGLEQDQVVTCELTVAEACLTQNQAFSNNINIEVYQIGVQVIQTINEHCDLEDGMIEVEGITGTAPYTFEWSEGTTTGILNNVSAGNYSVIVTDATGCTVEQSFDLISLTGPEILDVEIQGTNCGEQDGYAQIFMEAGEVFTYEWTNDNGALVSTSEVVNDLKAGRYYVAAMNEFGCVATRTVDIEEDNGILVKITAPDVVELGESITLKTLTFPQTTTDVIYEWTPANFLSCSDCPNPIATPTQQVTYTVTATTPAGCVSTDYITVSVSKERNVFIPNAFSPNNDGHNDRFAIYAGSEVSTIKNFQIFNRWGEVVYNQTNYNANDEVAGWDGKVKGKKLTSGVYIYVAEIEFTDGYTEVYKGDIMISL